MPHDENSRFQTRRHGNETRARRLPGRTVPRWSAILALAAGLVACGGGDRAAEAVNASAAATKKQVQAVVAPGVPAARTLFDATSFQSAADFDGDGKPDLLWFDPDSGSTVIWLMDGPRLAGGTRLPSWVRGRPVGTGDFDGDGRSDIVVYDADRDETQLLLVRVGAGGAFAFEARTILQGAQCRVIAAPDVDGDGKSDLLWSCADGSTNLWRIDATRSGVWQVGGRTLPAPSPFRVVALPDLNGDGKTDIVWHNPETGQSVAWLMDGEVASASVSLLFHPSYRVTGTADFDGNGKSDLIWRDPDTGETTVWLMDGLQLLGGRQLLRDPGYELVQTLAHADGRGADLLWLNATSGDTVLWVMEGLDLVGGGTLLRHPSFRPVATADFNGDGRADLLWYDPDTRTPVAWFSKAVGYDGLTLLTQTPFLLANYHEGVVLRNEPVRPVLERTLFAHFHFAGTDRSSVPFSIEQTQGFVEGGAESVPAFFSRVSRGRVRIVPSYEDVQPLSQTSAFFQTDDPSGTSMVLDALKILQRAGRLEQVDAVMLMLPPLAGGAPGRSGPLGKVVVNLGGKDYSLRLTWLSGNGFIGYRRLFVPIAMGRSFGMREAAQISLPAGCELPLNLLDPVFCSASQKGSVAQTGDSYDLMGRGDRGHPSLVRLLQAGWLDPRQIIRPAADDVYLLSPLDGGSRTAKVGLVLPLDSGVAARGIAYQVEYRTQPIVSSDTGGVIASTNQVQIRLSDQALVDQFGQTTVGTSYYTTGPDLSTSAMLLPRSGTSYWDRYRGVRFSWEATSFTAASVRVERSALQLQSSVSGALVRIQPINRGTRPIRLGAAELVGRDPGAFLIRSNDCSGALLAPGAAAACTIEVERPASAASHASLLIDSDDVLRPRAEFSLQ